MPTSTNDIKRRTAIWLLVLIMLLAGGMRLWVISRTMLPAGDGAGSNMELAVNLLEGRAFESDRKWTYYGPWGEWGPITHPEGNQQPLTSILVAGAILVGGVTYHSGQAVALLLSLASLVMLYLWTARRHNRIVALLACGLGAFSSSQLWFGTNLDTQVTYQFMTLLFLSVCLKWLPSSRENRVKPQHAFIIGIIAGLGYLARANGALLLGGFWLWLLFWGGGTGKSKTVGLARWWRYLVGIIPAALLSLLGFCILAFPWWLRNYEAFGSPFYSQNSYFIYADNFWGAWAVRSAPPSASEWFSHHNLWDYIIREVKGIYAAVEPFFLGNLHRNELYAEGPLVIFSIFGLLWIFRRGEGRRDGLVFLILALHIIGLAAHSHVFRYLLPFYLIVFAYGIAGLQTTWQDILAVIHKKFRPQTIRWLPLVLALFVIMPMLRPLAKTLLFDDREKGREIYQAADYFAQNSQPQDVVADFPVLETMIWMYQRRTILVPDDSTETISAVLASYQPVLLVATPELIARRPDMTTWLDLDKDEKIVDKNLPPNWKRVWAGNSGKTVIYRLSWQ